MNTKLFLASVVFLLCGCKSGAEGQPTVIRGVDFRFESIWAALCPAIEGQGFELRECNRDNRRITTYYKILPETNVADPMMRSHKARITLVPREALTGVKYDIEVRVGLYWKRKSPPTDPEERWDFIEWDREVEQRIVAEFHRRTAQDQRIKQGIEEYKKRGGR